MARGTQWKTDDIPDLVDRTYVVTGATSGLGLATAVELARHRATVVVTGRNADRLQTSWEAVAADASGPEPLQVLMDLADLASVRQAATEIIEATDKIDVLVNNAGVMATPQNVTADGFELQIGTNHLGHFALTGLLLNAMPIDDPTADNRVVNVSSGAHRMGKVNVGDLNYEDRSYNPWQAYGQSKLANLLFTLELEKKANAAGWSLSSLAAHPGWSATNLQFSGPKMAQNVVGKYTTQVANRIVGQSAEAGALPQLRAATDPTAKSGEYYGPDGFMEMRGKPVLVDRSSAAQDEVTAAELWNLSEELTGVVYPN